MNIDHHSSYKSTRFIYLLVVCILFFGVVIALDNLITVKKKANVLGSNIVYSPISKDDIIISPSSEFKHYYSLTPSTTLTETRFWDNTKAILTINKDGLNERYDYSIEKPQNTYRIVTLGDSYTYGYNIDTQTNWTEIIEDTLNNNQCSNHQKYEVVNLGMMGFDVPYIIKRYKDIGSKYNPDLIIWYESGSGFLRDLERSSPIALECIDRVSESGGGSISIRDTLTCWDDAGKEIENNTSIEDAQGRVNNWMNYFINIVGNTPVVIASGTKIDPDHKQLIQALINKNTNMFYTDNIYSVSPQKGTSLSVYDWHPNEKGHMLIAKDIYKYITSNDKLAINCNNSEYEKD